MLHCGSLQRIGEGRGRVRELYTRPGSLVAHVSEVNKVNEKTAAE